MMNRNFVLVLSILSISAAWGQTMHKCPGPTLDAPPIIQQMPCSPTGGGETMTVHPPKPGDNSIAESTARMKALSSDLNQYWAEQVQIDKAESDRREALAAEQRKAKAAEDQAAAQRATAAAIWATRRR